MHGLVALSLCLYSQLLHIRKMITRSGLILFVAYLSVLAMAPFTCLVCFFIQLFRCIYQQCFARAVYLPIPSYYFTAKKINLQKIAGLGVKVHAGPSKVPALLVLPSSLQCQVCSFGKYLHIPALPLEFWIWTIMMNAADTADAKGWHLH